MTAEEEEILDIQYGAGCEALPFDKTTSQRRWWHAPIALTALCAMLLLDGAAAVCARIDGPDRGYRNGMKNSHFTLLLGSLCVLALLFAWLKKQ